MNKEQIKFTIIPQLHNLELLHAAYGNYTFSKHIHENYAIGVVERGALGFSYHGERLVSYPGSINLVVPGEAHDGYAASQNGWTYRMFYIYPEMMEKVMYYMSDRIHQLPYFKAGVIQNKFLAAYIRNLHIALSEPQGISLIEQESLLLTMLTVFISRYAEEKPCVRRIEKEKKMVRSAVSFIEENYMRNISIRELSDVCHLSPYYLIRMFHECMGVPPHMYLKQVRIHRVKDLLGKGYSLLSAAQETGFTDQSHLTKQFKQITEITPKKYSNSIQEIAGRKAKIK